MSLLLDALNKADQERKRNANTPSINSNHDGYIESASDRNSNSLWIFLFVIIALCIIAGLYFSQKETPVTPSPTTITEKNILPAQQSPSTALTNNSAVASHSITTTPSENTNTEKNIAAPETHIADLYHQQTSTTKPTSNSVASTINTVPAAINPAPTTPQIVAAPSSINQFANLPELHDLPGTVLNKIPSLNYSEHHYNANGGSVMINGIIRHVDDQPANGLVIDKILEDGMILHYDNYSFKMRALNSWVNM